MPVNRPLQVLLVQSDDTALVLEQLQKVGSRTIVSERVGTVKAFREALEKNNWDIAIARFDYRVSIAQLSYAELLHILREYQLDIPLILVVEEITASVAIRAIKAGVNDIVTTAELERLNESVEYELHAAQSQAGLNQTKQELELRVQERTAQLIQTEKMSSLGQLVAGIAHEINNPVNFIYNNLNFATEYSQNILNLLELYQQHYPNPPIEIQSQAEEIELDFVKEDLPKILSSMQIGTDRICEIILSLRNFSRTDQKTPQTIDIHQVIDSVILILQHRLRRIGDNPGIEIIKEYQQLPLIKCYPGQLNQVFMNLIANAIDAVEEGVGSGEWGVGESRSRGQGDKGTRGQEGVEGVKISSPTPYSLLPTPSIRIRTQLSDNQSCVLICIADNGPGISPEKLIQIFNTFFTTKPVGKGTGLGLSISQQIIVEKHCGRLWCTSELGQGTEFWIEIPIEGNI